MNAAVIGLVMMVVGTGQSLSVGHRAVPVVGMEANPKGLMFVGGTRAGLVDNGDTGQEIGGAALVGTEVLEETGQEDMGAGLTEGATVPTLVVELGVSAQPYVALRKGTVPYGNMVTAVRAAYGHYGTRLRVPVMTVVHGESDEQNGTLASEYEADLVEWQRDFNGDVQGILGAGTQNHVMMLTDQMSSWTRLAGYPATARIPYGQLRAFQDHPGDIRLVGPKYFLAYQADGVHLTAVSEELLGRYYAEAMGHDIAVYPVNAARVGNVITVHFHQGYGPLVLDRESVSDPNGMAGFEYHDDYNSAGIRDVAIGADVRSVVVTLTAAPAAGSHPRIRYAYTGVPGANAGPMTGPRGCLRDSAPLPDWAVHFDQTVN